jgi:hypothetical protein
MKRRILKVSYWFFGILLGIVLLITTGVYVFKDEICGYVIQEVNKHLKAKVKVDEVDLTFWGSFPSLSVDFNKVFIQDAYKNATAKDTLLYSDRIRMKFNPMDIWEENYKVHSIEVEPGTIQLKVNRRGQVNYDILKETKDTVQTSFDLALESVDLEEVRLSYHNKATAQYYKTSIASLNLEGNFDQDRFSVATTTKLLINKIRSGKITLLSNQEAELDLSLNVDKTKDLVEIPKALIKIAGLPFEVAGFVNPNQTKFELHSKDFQLTELANRFAVSETDEIDKYSGTGTAYADLYIESNNKRTEPAKIKCLFGIKEGSLTEPASKIKLSKVQLEGEYNNSGGAGNEFLNLKKLKINTPGGPFKGELKLTQFDHPRIVGNADGVLNLGMLHQLFRFPYVEKVNGNVNVSTDFIVQTIIEQGTKDYSVEKCEGNVQLNHVGLKLENDHRYFNDMSGSLYLRNDEAGVDNVSLNVGASDLKFDGIFKNIFNYFAGTGKLEADVEIKGNYIDLQDLGTTTKEEKIQDAREYVLPDDIGGTMFTEVAEIKYENHRFKNVSGKMEMKNRRLFFPNVSLRNADADISGSLTIEERSAEIFHITTEVQSQNLQFKSLFKEWDNFNQSVIGEENIYGKAQSKVYFEAPFDLRSGILSRSIKSQVYLKITEGRLKNVAAFKSITESLQTNTAKMVIGKENIAQLEKKLMDLRFETLENTFIIENGKLTIPEMMIHTSALDIETSGTHTFENMIDYRFAFRFRDLKAGNRATEFGTEIDDGTGMKVYMRMYGNIDNPTIVWDKSSRKEQLKDDLKQEKETVKSMLKSEFGLFKGDSTVKSYEHKEGPKEVLKVEFGPATTEDPIEEKKVKKDSKLKNTLKNWKEEADKDKQEKIEFD